MTESPYVRKISGDLFRNLSVGISILDIEITERCNNSCIHCLINQPQNSKSLLQKELKTTEIKDIAYQASRLGCFTIRLTGGEPLLRDDFFEIYKYIRSLGISVIIFTNARLISEDHVRLFSRIPPGRPIEVSVYGVSKSSYEQVSKSKNSFMEFMRGVDYLKSYKVPFLVKQSVLFPNREEISDFEKFAREDLQIEQKPNYSYNFDLRVRRDNLHKNEAIKKLRFSPSDTVSFMKKFPGYKTERLDFIRRFMYTPGLKLFTCGAGNQPCVDSYGYLQMCLLLKHPSTLYKLDFNQECNHIDSGNLHSAITSFFPVIKELSATNPEYIKRCAKCFLKGLCQQCPAKSWIESGTLDTPVEYLCSLAHEEARELELLLPGEYSWDINQKESQKRIMKLVSVNH